MIYLDNGATSYPKPKKVIEMIHKTYEQPLVNVGRNYSKIGLDLLSNVYSCRENIAKVIGVDNPLNIAFTKNSTEAINIVLKGLLNNKSKVLISNFEHNAVVRPLIAMDSKIDFMDDTEGVVNIESLEKKLKSEKYDLLVITLSSNVTGLIQPVNEIAKLAKNNNIKVLLDASQGLGYVSFEGSLFDYIAAPGHKSLYGPQGTGFLYVKDENTIGELINGGTGSISESPTQPSFMPDKFESGTLNTPGIIALNAGVEFVLENRDSMKEKEFKLTKYCIEKLVEIDDIEVIYPKNHNRSGIVSFRIIDEDSNDLGTYLSDKGIILRSGLHCAYLAHKRLNTLDTGLLRVGIGFFNKIDDIEILIDEIKKYMEER